MVYDIANLVISDNECTLRMMNWLLVCHIMLLVMKAVLTIIDSIDDEANCLSTLKLIAFIIYIILFPFLVFWNVLGTIWYLNIQDQIGTECVNFVLII
jgi:hypothetical protein